MAAPAIVRDFHEILHPKDPVLRHRVIGGLYERKHSLLKWIDSQSQSLLPCFAATVGFHEAARFAARRMIVFEELRLKSVPEKETLPAYIFGYLLKYLFDCREAIQNASSKCLSPKWRHIARKAFRGELSNRAPGDGW